MSRSVDLFIDADLPLDELAGALGRQTGSSLVPEADQARWVLQEGDARATLAEHPYCDDGDLPFSRYRFALSARVSNDVRPHDTAEAALLRRVAHQIQQGLDLAGPAGPRLAVPGAVGRRGEARAGSGAAS